MCAPIPRLLQGPLAADPLKFVNVRRCYDVHALLAALDDLAAEHAQQQQQQQQQQQAAAAAGPSGDSRRHLHEFPVKLLVVDSLSALISPVLGGGQHSQGHALLAAAAATLKAFADATQAGALRACFAECRLPAVCPRMPPASKAPSAQRSALHFRPTRWPLECTSPPSPPPPHTHHHHHHHHHPPTHPPTPLTHPPTPLTHPPTHPAAVVLVTNHLVGGSDERRHEKRPAMGESWRNQPHTRWVACGRLDRGGGITD